ncbi:hypothetical protein C8R47DRAFT_1068495 [Mycena vitilis]|nr:hypothetical protein C8R47DRAFT_1068495 [Mycena vitilis]
MVGAGDERLQHKRRQACKATVPMLHAKFDGDSVDSKNYLYPGGARQRRAFFSIGLWSRPNIVLSDMDARKALKSALGLLVAAAVRSGASKEVKKEVDKERSGIAMWRIP